MLNKEICKKCINNRSKSLPLTSDRTFAPVSWYDSDDQRWDNFQTIWCRFNYNTDEFPINVISKHCLYKLEHLVISNVK